MFKCQSCDKTCASNAGLKAHITKSKGKCSKVEESSIEKMIDDKLKTLEAEYEARFLDECMQSELRISEKFDELKTYNEAENMKLETKLKEFEEKFKQLKSEDKSYIHLGLQFTLDKLIQLILIKYSELEDDMVKTIKSEATKELIRDIIKDTKNESVA